MICGQNSRMRLATDQDAQMLHANPDFTLIFNDTRIPVFALISNAFSGDLMALGTVGR